MNIKRTTLSAAIISILGASNGIDTAHAGTVAPGAYELVILTTLVQTITTGGGGTSTQFNFGTGTGGNWQSSFTFGGQSPPASSQAMTDTGASIADACGSVGSGIANDNLAGKLDINIATSGDITVSSFAKDTIFATAGGDFAQYLTSPTHPAGDTSQMTGTVDLTTGALTLDPTGRLGGITLPPENCDKRWNVPDSLPKTPPPYAFPPLVQTTYGFLSTGTANTRDAQIGGKAFSATADQNSDGISDYLGVLVSGGTVGTDWGGFTGAQYFEVWRTRLLTKGPIVNDDTYAGPPGLTTTHDVLENDLPTGANLGMLVTNVTYSGGKATVSITAGGKSVTYIGNAGIIGTDSYTYTATGPNGVSRTATVTVINSDPGAAPDSGTTKQGQSVTIDLADDDFASAGKNLASYAPQATSDTVGTVTDDPPGATATATYTPPLDFVGTDTFTYTFQDNNASPKTSNIATVTVTVTPFPVVSQGTYDGGTIAGAGTDGAVGPDDVPDDAGVSTRCLGGCFDFVVTGTDNPARIVLPRLDQQLDTSVSIRYRVLAGGEWKDFDTTGGDAIASTVPTANGGCPGPASSAWKPWTGADAGAEHNDDTCVRLTIADGGPNDSAGSGTIAITGGPGQFIPKVQPSGTINDFLKSTSGGCTIGGERATLTSRADWAMLGVIGLWLGALRLRRRQSR